MEEHQSDEQLRNELREARGRESQSRRDAERFTTAALDDLRRARDAIFEAKQSAAQIGAIIAELKRRGLPRRTESDDAPEYVRLHREQIAP